GLCLAGLCLPGLCLPGLGLPGYRRGGAAGRWCEADLPAAGPALTSLLAGGRRTPGLRVSGFRVSGFRVSGLRALARRALRALGPRTRGLGVAARLGPIRLSRVLSRALLRVLLTPVLLRSEEHTSELQSRENLVCRLL